MPLKRKHFETFLVYHEELHAVEDNPGNVADDEDDNDEDEDCYEVELPLNVCTPLSLVRSISDHLEDCPLLFPTTDFIPRTILVLKNARVAPGRRQVRMTRHQFW